MQAMKNGQNKSFRLLAQAGRAGLLALLGICLGAGAASAQAPPIVVTGPSTVIGSLNFNGAGGGWFSGQAPLGGTFVVGADGSVIVGDGYGGTSGKSGIFQITGAGVQTMLANFTNSNAAGIDQYGNVYVARDYGDSVIKLPFYQGAYVGFTGGTPTNNCAGGTSDSAPCVFAPNVKSFMDGVYASSNNPGFTSLFFDAQGNFFFATDTTPGNSGLANTIFECSVKCQTETDGAGTYPPVAVYADPGVLGVVAVDPWGNLWFSDGPGNSSGQATSVEELPISNGTYASKPTVITTYTSSANYNAIAGVSASNLNAVYFSIPYDGVFAIPNSASGPNAAGIYKVSGQGGKGLTMDAAGDLYVVNYANSNSADSIIFTPMGNIGFGGSPVGTATASTAITVIDNAGNCTSAPTLAFSVSSTEYVVTPPATGSCSTAQGTSAGTFTPALASYGASFSAGVVFTPAQAGPRLSVLTITDAGNSAAGRLALRGVGQAAAANVDPGVMATFSTGLSKPSSIVADAAGDVFIADAGAGKVYELAFGSTSLTSLGSGFSKPDALEIDTNGDLFIGDNGTSTVDVILNSGSAGTFTAGTQMTIVSTSDLFGGMPLGSVTGLTFGPKGSLYISDPANNRVVYYNAITGEAGVTLANANSGVMTPMGLAADPGGILYIADAGQNAVLELANGVLTTIQVPGVTIPAGVATDASGSLFVADAATGSIFRASNQSGTPDTAHAVAVETLGSASSLWSDPAGDLFAASVSGKTVYGIVRNSVSINLGVVADGTSGNGTVYLMNSGNEAALLGTPAVTEPGTTGTLGQVFDLSYGNGNGQCSDGTSGPAGALCTFTAEFNPPAGSGASGPYSGTASIDIATPALTIPVQISGTATTSSLKSQTITFTPPATGYVGQQLTLAATATSGLAVTFSTTTPNVCGVVGNAATFNATGTCTIDANQPGDTTWGAAPQVSASITISYVTQADVPAILMNQSSFLKTFPGGGAFAQDSAAGSTFGVNAAGQVLLSTSYGDTVIMYDPTAAAFTTLGNYGKYNNTGGVTLDAQGNLYVGALYSGIVVKVPYVGGKYAALTDATSGSAPANCTGSDTTECVVGPVSNVSGIGGVSAMTFDAQGDLFLADDDQGAAFSIWECTAACLSTGTPAPVMIYQEPAGANKLQLYVGALAVDPWGNLFFTDSNLYNQSNNLSESYSSNVNELPTSTGAGFGGATTGFAAAPVVLQTLTDSSPGGYDDEIDGIAVGADGTVYYAAQYDGVFAIPNSQAGGPDTAHQYAVAGQGAKEIALDSKGNIFFVSYSGGDALGEIVTNNNLATPVGQLNGPAVTAPANVIDNAFGCNLTASFVFVSSDPQFSATPGTSACQWVSANFSTGVAGGAYTATLSFAATSAGPQKATLSISDVANGGEGTSTVNGVGQETPQTIAFTAPTTTTVTYAPGLTVTVSATNGGSNNPVVFAVDPGSSGAGTFGTSTVTGTTSTAALTVTQAGSIVIDATEPGGLVSGIYYSDAPQVQLTLTVNPASQTITFTPPASPVTYAPGLTITLSATGGASTQPVTFSIDNSSTATGTVNGNVVTVTGAGNLIIDANQASNVDYAAAPTVSQTVVVNQAAQAITFTPPSQPIHFIVGGITVPLSATGGASGNPVVFSVDSSTPAGIATVSGSNLLVTGAGSIVVDANQAASTNYSAAPQAQEIITILAPLPTQTITFNNPGTQVEGTPLTLNATASSGFPVTYMSMTTSVCTVASASNTWTATFVDSGTCTIVATQPGDNATFAAAAPVSQTFIVNATGVIPNIGLNFTLNALTLEPGTNGLTTLTVASTNSFTGQVNFACSGLPSGYSCTFTPNPITVQPNASSSTNLVISGSTTGMNQNSRPLLPVAALAAALCWFGFRKRNRLQMLLLVVIAIVGLGVFSGCGGSSSAPTSKPTTSTVTVTATSGAVSASATLNVTVE